MAKYWQWQNDCYLAKHHTKQFISNHPVGSGIIHLPELWIGGNYIFFISRLVVCLQLACIATFTILLSEKAATFSGSFLVKCVAIIIAFLLSINTFHLAANTTIDALFCVITGTWLSTFRNRYIKQIGYGVAGFAALCQFSLLLMPVLLIGFKSQL